MDRREAVSATLENNTQRCCMGSMELPELVNDELEKNMR
jgi:hypothetical protein